MIKNMFYKRAATTTLLFVFFWASTMAPVNAATMGAEQTRTMLLAQIEKLVAEVIRLQALLNEKTKAASPASYSQYTPYKSVFFPLSFESIYVVKDGELFSTSASGNIREVDKQLFNLFTAVIGKAEVKRNVMEWRVFNDTSTDLGAFVELITGTEDWVVGVNRADFSIDDEQMVRAFANLFLHEYAHVLLFENPDFTKSFEDRFWTSADLQHAEKVAKTSESKRFDVMVQYYDNNSSRFVSDYATMNSEEDMAETFVSFIRDSKPTGNTIKENKILAFYQEQEFVNLRTELRANLSAINALK